MSALEYSPNPGRANRLVGLLLLYYEPYAEAALRRFVTLLKSIDPHFNVVVIMNQPLSMKDVPGENIHLIQGDNRLHEFSGWDAGLLYCRQQGILPQEGIIVFANDTFCHHNRFGPISKLAFARAFKQMLARPKRLAMAGEVHSDTDTYSISGRAFSSWISTYLFALTIPMLKQLGSIAPSLDLDAFFSNRIESERFFCGPINIALRRKLIRWLFGEGGQASWYGAQLPTLENMTAMTAKAKAVICELYLSASVMHFNGTLTSVFRSPWLRLLRRVERKQHG